MPAGVTEIVLAHHSIYSTTPIWATFQWPLHPLRPSLTDNRISWSTLLRGRFHSPPTLSSHKCFAPYSSVSCSVASCPPKKSAKKFQKLIWCLQISMPQCFCFVLLLSRSGSYGGTTQHSPRRRRASGSPRHSETRSRRFFSFLLDVLLPLLLPTHTLCRLQLREHTQEELRRESSRSFGRSPLLPSLVTCPNHRAGARKSDRVPRSTAAAAAAEATSFLRAARGAGHQGASRGRHICRFSLCVSVGPNV